MKRRNKVDQARVLLERNPRMKTAEVMKALGTTKSYTYVLMSKARKLNEESKPKGELLYRLTGTQAKLANKMGVPLEDYALLAGEVIAKPDPVNHPLHYVAGGIEVIDFIEAKKLGYNLGNVVKYIARADYKGNKLEDLRKAQWYLTRAIESLK